MLKSALKVQDFGKLFVMVSIAIGMICVSVGAKFGWDSFVPAILNLFQNF